MCPVTCRGSSLLSGGASAAQVGKGDDDSLRGAPSGPQPGELAEALREMQAAPVSQVGSAPAALEGELLVPPSMEKQSAAVREQERAEREVALKQASTAPAAIVAPAAAAAAAAGPAAAVHMHKPSAEVALERMRQAGSGAGGAGRGEDASQASLVAPSVGPSVAQASLPSLDSRRNLMEAAEQSPEEIEEHIRALKRRSEHGQAAGRVAGWVAGNGEV